MLGFNKPKPNKKRTTMKATKKIIRSLVVGCLLVCYCLQNLNAQIPPGVPLGGGGTNVYNPYPGFNPTPTFSYPTNATLKWRLRMNHGPQYGFLSLSPDGFLYVPVESTQVGGSYDLSLSLWSINVSLVDTNDADYPSPINFTNWIAADLANGPYSSQITPVIANDGAILTTDIGSYSLLYRGYLPISAINPTNGSTIWSFYCRIGFTQLDISSQPVVGPDGTIYISTATFVYALTNAFGKTNFYSNTNIYARPLTNVWIKWLYQEDAFAGAYNFQYSRPALSSDGTLYVNADNGRMYAFNSTNGTLKWVTTPPTNANGATPTSPAIASDGTIFFGQGADLVAVDPKSSITNGKIPYKWVYFDPTIINGSGYLLGEFSLNPVIGTDGTVYSEISNLGGYTNKLVALNPKTGLLKWSAYAGSGQNNSYAKFGSLAVAADGEIFSAESDGSVYSFDPFGNTNWIYQTDSQVLGSPLIGPDGTLYVESLDGNIYAFCGSAPIACSSWPEDGKNARRTSSVSLATSSLPTKNTNGFKFQINGATNAPVCACASSDLKTWTNIGQTILTGGKTNFVDIDAANYPYRFYRAFPQ